MNGSLQDVRYAVRQLRKSPGFTAVAVITLALAVGANTAIFSVVRKVLVDSLPYRDVDRLMMIWGSNPSRGDHRFPISAGDFGEWQQKNDAFENIAASYDDELTLTGTGEPKLVLGYAVSSNYMRILGVSPRVGHMFTEQEAQSKTDVVVLSDKFWTNTLHGDPDIVGKSITLDTKPYTVIGVMPAGFAYPDRTELWKPLSVAAASGDYEHRYIRVLGKLKEGVSLAKAQARMNALQAQIAARHPDTDAGNETSIESLRQQLTGDIRPPLLALSGAVGLVLIIACVNIASLLLARATGRRAEVSLRVAIGASRLHLLRQFLSENLVLSFLGGALGVGLAFVCTRFLLAIFPNGVANLSIPRVEAIPMNTPVLAFALGITILTGLIFGAVPALQLANADPNEALKESRGTTMTSRSGRIRSLLVTTQIALSLALLAGGGLMVESFHRAYQQNIGFRPNNLLALEVFLPRTRYPEDPPEKRLAFVSNTLERLKNMSGVASVAATNFLPLSGFWGTTDFTIEGRMQSTNASKPQADNRLITPDYFSTMGIELLRGRSFTDADRLGSGKVAVVNAALARRYFGAEDPIDKILDIGDTGHLERWRIVGEVADVKAFGPEQAAHADLYRPLAQQPFPLLAFVVRTQSDPSALLKTAERAIWDLDKDQPVFDAMPMSVLAAQSMTLRRTSTILLAGFAALALIVAGVGLYGLIAYSVAQRTHEIGVRMALGARRSDVLLEVVRRGMRLVVIGEVAGFVLSLLLTRMASGVLYGVSPSDPSSLAIAIFLLTIVALAACYVPALRATKVDPMVALRYE
jgi:predicted permease